MERTHVFVAHAQIQSEPGGLLSSHPERILPTKWPARQSSVFVLNVLPSTVAQKEIGNRAAARSVERIPGVSAAEAKVSSFVSGIQVVGLYPLEVNAES